MSTKSLIKTNEVYPAVFEDLFKAWNEWFSNGGSNGKTMNLPAVNVSENEGEYSLSVACPGMKKEDFKLDVAGNMLTVSSEKEETKNDKEARYTRREYNFSSFTRSFSLPEDVNQQSIEASYKDGVLVVTLPKKEESKKIAGSTHISVK